MTRRKWRRERLEQLFSDPRSSAAKPSADVVRSFPWWSDAWAELGDLARDDVEAYACFRVGYHRGLDALRRSGWRGSRDTSAGASPSNRGFLRCVEGLRSSAAAAIGETEEEERCAVFLRQLDPAWPPDDSASDVEQVRAGRKPVDPTFLGAHGLSSFRARSSALVRRRISTTGRRVASWVSSSGSQRESTRSGLMPPTSRRWRGSGIRERSGPTAPSSTSTPRTRTRTCRPRTNN